jgi:GTP-binding protein EngB required for normal cell division
MIDYQLHHVNPYNSTPTCKIIIIDAKPLHFPTAHRRAQELPVRPSLCSKQALDEVIPTFGSCDKDYFSVAIIGAQNTGKSTLLNHLFKTSFAVLKGEAGRRTTRGVILGRDHADRLLIMDVEGNDSYETHVEGD